MSSDEPVDHLVRLPERSTAVEASSLTTLRAVRLCRRKLSAYRRLDLFHESVCGPLKKRPTSEVKQRVEHSVQHLYYTHILPAECKVEGDRFDHSSHSLYLLVAELTEQEVKIVRADFFCSLCTSHHYNSCCNDYH